MNGRVRFSAVLVGAITLGAGSAVVRGDDHQGLRQALERNEIVSFKTILDWIEENYVGQIVEVELEDDDDDELLIYEVDLLTPRGDKLEFEFDARSGQLLNIEGRDLEAARRR
ncbi:PepSY domain-containing protein [Panacagrimonas sp.]|uniref:PepSY domain-containing protein n=1 Tax=Panacagrimonas sp. TaxID=2480088 RepID=UPI003B517673